MGPQPIVEVFLLAENRLLREALQRVLAKKNEIRIVGTSSYSTEILQQVVAASPHIIVLDSGGLSHSNARLVSLLLTSLPGVKVVMVDMDADEEIFLRAVREGVAGYVLKDASAAELAATIRAVSCGEAVCPPMLSAALFRFASQQSNVSSSLACGAELGLSRREQQLVELLRARLTNKEIASQLNLSEQTVKNHVHNIMRKLGATDRLAAVRRCEVEQVRLEAPALRTGI
jgi:DNA-binding NarL/FixJ family response regulator